MSDDRTIGYFVHHQGRGHAERAKAIAHALIARRKVTLFCARNDIFGEIDPAIEIVTIPSLFEATGSEAPAMAALPMPKTTHCAPIGWPTITQATGTIVQWFAERNPALFITDVSAELGQLARLCSVPHISVLQHGNRDDAAHNAAYEGAVGLLAPYAAKLEQHDRPSWLKAKTHYASGVGIECDSQPQKCAARRKLGLDMDRNIVLVIAGSGGDGTPSAPLTLGARAEPDTQWITIGKMHTEWHETPPGNLDHRGWVDDPRTWIAAADRIVSSCGNTTVHMVLAAGKPWIVVPEWRYFDEQLCKAEVLDREGLAAVSRHWPSHIDAWNRLWSAAAHVDRDAQRRIINHKAANEAADWIDDLATYLWAGSRTGRKPLEVVA